MAQHETAYVCYERWNCAGDISGYLCNVNGHQGLGKSAKLAGLDDTRNCSPVHVLENDVQVGPCLEGANVLHDIFMIQVLQQLYLPHDALQGFS